MADVIIPSARLRTTPHEQTKNNLCSDLSDPLAANLKDQELRKAMELLFRAYRDFTREPDVLLQDYGFGRAHHRVLYFVGTNPSITVNKLLAILQITKQSLSRVLGQLIERKFIKQISGAKDRRQRLLSLTREGKELEKKLFLSQKKLFTRAYDQAGMESVEGFLKVLDGLILPPRSSPSSPPRNHEG